MKTKTKISNKGLFTIVSMILVFLSLSGQKVIAAKPITLKVDGKDITSLSSPIIQNGRTLVPVRFVIEQLGGSVEWNQKDRIAKVEKDNSLITFKIDSHIVVNENEGKSYQLSDIPPKIINSRTFIPLRLLSNALGISVEWDEETRTIFVDSKKEANIEPLFDVKISTLKNGQVIKGKTDLEISLSSDGIKNGEEIKYLLLDPKTVEGIVVARGNILDKKYTWIPRLEDSGEKILVAAIYDKNGRFIAGDSVQVQMKVVEQVELIGVTKDEVIEDIVSIGANTSFIASYVKYEITNLDKNKIVLSSESDPGSLYKWSPMFEDNGNYSFKVIAYDKDDKAYESKAINVKVNVKRKISLLGVSNGITVDKPITLSTGRNFQVSETEYILRDPNSGKETVLAKMGYGNYKWFPGPELSGTKELLVRVRDTRNTKHESKGIQIKLTASPKLLLEGIGPKQVVTESIKLKGISNVKLDSIDYILINATTGAKKTLASNQNPSSEYTYTPSKGDNGNWKIRAEGKYNSGKKVISEEIPFKVYLGKTYGPAPIVEKSKFLDLASKLAKNSWKKTGMSASLQTAQAILETGWGQSVPVDKYNGKLSNNLFGIKGTGTAGAVISNTWEEYNGKVFRIDAEFRAYKTIDESWTDHKSFLLNSNRYKPFIEVMHDSTQGAWALKTAGYATDSQYPLKLMRIIKQYNLQELDKISL